VFRLALVLCLGMVATANGQPEPEAVTKYRQQHPDKNVVYVGRTGHTSALQDDVTLVLAPEPGKNSGKSVPHVVRPGDVKDFQVDRPVGKSVPGEWVWFNGTSRQQTYIKGATTVIVERGKNGALQWYGLKVN
jgi:hypothetical protein